MTTVILDTPTTRTKVMYKTSRPRFPADTASSRTVVGGAFAPGA
ncbi:hypothetical protein [Salipiger sp.]